MGRGEHIRLCQVPLADEAGVGLKQHQLLAAERRGRSLADEAGGGSKLSGPENRKHKWMFPSPIRRGVTRNELPGERGQRPQGSPRR